MVSLLCPTLFHNQYLVLVLSLHVHLRYLLWSFDALLVSFFFGSTKFLPQQKKKSCMNPWKTVFTWNILDLSLFSLDVHPCWNYHSYARANPHYHWEQEEPFLFACSTWDGTCFRRTLLGWWRNLQCHRVIRFFTLFDRVACNNTFYSVYIYQVFIHLLLLWRHTTESISYWNSKSYFYLFLFHTAIQE